jgi:hypothetical protein
MRPCAEHRTAWITTISKQAHVSALHGQKPGPATGCSPVQWSGKGTSERSARSNGNPAFRDGRLWDTHIVRFAEEWSSHLGLREASRRVTVFGKSFNLVKSIG